MMDTLIDKALIQAPARHWHNITSQAIQFSDDMAGAAYANTWYGALLGVFAGKGWTGLAIGVGLGFALSPVVKYSVDFIASDNSPFEKLHKRHQQLRQHKKWTPMAAEQFEANKNAIAVQNADSRQDAFKRTKHFLDPLRRANAAESVAKVLPA